MTFADVANNEENHRQSSTQQREHHQERETIYKTLDTHTDAMQMILVDSCHSQQCRGREIISRSLAIETAASILQSTGCSTQSRRRQATSLTTCCTVCICNLMPSFQHYVSVHPCPYLRDPFQECVRIAFICKNSVAYVKNNVLRCHKFAVSVQIGHEFYFFRIRLVHGMETATALRNDSADTDYGNGYLRMNGYTMLMTISIRVAWVATHLLTAVGWKAEFSGVTRIFTQGARQTCSQKQAYMLHYRNVCI